MSFYEMAIIDTCENYCNFSHVPIRDFSMVENLIKHCGLYFIADKIQHKLKIKMKRIPQIGLKSFTNTEAVFKEKATDDA